MEDIHSCIRAILNSHERFPGPLQDPREDTFFYRCLLKLSLYTSADWWARFKSECMVRPGLELPDCELLVKQALKAPKNGGPPFSGA